MHEIVWNRDLVEKFWTGVSNTRLKEQSFAKTGGLKLFELVKPYLPMNGTILDYGTGNGDFVRMLTSNGYRTGCFELSEKQKNNLLTQDFAQSSLFMGVYDDNSMVQFDVVVCFEVMEHVLDVDLTSTLGRLKKVLKPDGLLIVTVPNNEDVELGKCYCPNCDRTFHRWQHVRSFSKESIAALFRQHGFALRGSGTFDLSPEAETRIKYTRICEAINSIPHDDWISFNQKLVHVDDPIDMRDFSDTGAFLVLIFQHESANVVFSKPFIKDVNEKQESSKLAVHEKQLLVLLKAYVSAGARGLKRHKLTPPFTREGTYGWVTTLSAFAQSADDPQNPTRSTLLVFEDENPLGPAHASHEEIRTLGGGCFSHWADSLYFSTSDNSDPNTNGKTYTVLGVMI